MKQLVRLELGGTLITNPGVEQLVLVPAELTELGLAGTYVTDLRSLGPLRKLRRLNLNSSGVSDAGLSELARHSELTKLHLGRTKITNAVLKEVGKLTKLTDLDRLYFDHGRRTGGALGGLEVLTELNISGTKVTGSGFTVLVKLQRLRVLLTESRPFVDANVKEIGRLKGLWEVQLPVRTVSEKTAQELQALLPETIVLRN